MTVGNGSMRQAISVEIRYIVRKDSEGSYVVYDTGETGSWWAERRIQCSSAFLQVGFWGVGFLCPPENLAGLRKIVACDDPDDAAFICRVIEDRDGGVRVEYAEGDKVPGWFPKC